VNSSLSSLLSLLCFFPRCKEQKKSSKGSSWLPLNATSPAIVNGHRPWDLKRCPTRRRQSEFRDPLPPGSSSITQNNCGRKVDTGEFSSDFTTQNWAPPILLDERNHVVLIYFVVIVLIA
ncbi:hypothetical protein TorRG33x02_163950, partial [Trema orientale]